MKDRQWILRSFIIVLIYLACFICASSPPLADFTLCKTNMTQVLCFAHGSCESPPYRTDASYIVKEEFWDGFNMDCKRYLIMRPIDMEKVEIEFRDNKLNKQIGVEFKYKNPNDKEVVTFSCINNTAFSKEGIVTQSDNSSVEYDELHCKFQFGVKFPSEKNIQELLLEVFPIKVYGNQGETNISINIPNNRDHLRYFVYSPCNWSVPLFTNAFIDLRTEEAGEWQMRNTSEGRLCPLPFEATYQRDHNYSWQITGAIMCCKGKISAECYHFLDVNRGRIKCSKTRCNMCECPFCKGRPSAGPNAPEFRHVFDPQCSEFKCPKYMLVETDSGSYVHSSNVIKCSMESTLKAPKWEGYSEIKKVTCIDESTCAELLPAHDCTGMRIID